MDPSFNENGLNTLSPMQNFFKGKSVFITGGSGFLGKVLIEKLVRSCPALKAIYLLIRPKKGKNAEERVNEIISDLLFNEIKKQNPQFASIIVPISGDCTELGLGINEEQKKILLDNVNIVIHAAATVRFDEPLKKALDINVTATQEIINLCYSMKALEAFVYVSTAFSNCHMKNVKEDVFEWSTKYEEAMMLVKELTPEEIEKRKRFILGPWPNTYTFTKALSECFVKKVEGKVPACVFRPAIVTSTHSEPVPGWIDNFLGPTGLVLGIGCGIIRAVHCDTKADINIVPVDLVINGILAAAYETALNFQNEKKRVKVYNFVSNEQNPIIYKDFEDLLEKYGLIIPSIKAVWYYSVFLCRSESLTYFLWLILHWLPAVLIDIVAVLSAKKPVMINLYKKIHKLINALGYFATQNWIYETNNVRSLWDNISEHDKKIFNFDVRCIKWDPYIKNYITGARVYVLKDDLSTLGEARKKWNRLYWYHQIVKLTFAFLGFFVLSYGIRKVSTTLV